MKNQDPEIESAQFRQGIARAWLRVDRRKRLSYRLGYVFGRIHFYWMLLIRRRAQ